MKRCYYEVLGVERKAAADDIKMAYRKMAIKYHPDKNDSEDATQRFQEINEAYSVLSDPNERSWYDNHREQILNNEPDGPMTDKDMEMKTFGVNIWAYFTSSCYSGFGDGEKGFYSVYRNLFEILKGQEERAKDDHSDSEDEDTVKNVFKAGKDAPGFGDSKTSFERVEEFYKYWDHFTSLRRFRWADIYNETQAPNRQIKRLMHKDNQKERNKERKKFHDTVKQLVDYVKKRDPRYQEMVKSKLADKQKKIEEEKRQQEEKKKEKAEMRKRMREEEAARYEQELKEKKEKGELSDHEEEQEGTGENIHYEDFYCDICEKEFKTENQLVNHLASKAHIKKHKQLMEEVMLEEEKQEFENKDEEAESQSPPAKSNKKKNKKKKNKAKNKATEDELSENPSKKSGNEKVQSKKKVEEDEAPKKKESESEEEDADDDDIDLQAFSKLRPAETKVSKAEATQQDSKQSQSKFFQSHDDDDEEEVLEHVEVKKEKPTAANTNQEEGSDGDEESAALNGILPSKKSQKKKEKKKKKFQNAMEPDFGDEIPEKNVKAEKKITAETEKDTKGKEEAPEKETIGNAKEQDKKPSLNAAKLKKLKKKEKEQAAETFVCNVCKESFETRNKLFQHVKDQGHELTGMV
eukprot:CAMPEP_0176462606 /NCGR_PEP_ID=MMETSP0127-20121128/35378_1 /TAXON_ID=938130 /ORGANISM="Platyophrya macrostoma, Strain WH" /LENGTH=635 /DNA_ID=CAMNT_0017854577 /DNA_START=24 /DNA_END=1927 /DNA_ORIENTATION=-